MKRTIARLALVVKDYDEAKDFYMNKLDFELVEDTPLTPSKRWVVLSPPGAQECSLLLARAANERQGSAVGNQTGGRVFLFMYTDDFWRDYQMFTQRGVHFVRSPQEEPYGTVAVFEDLYGNQWDLIQPTISD